MRTLGLDRDINVPVLWRWFHASMKDAVMSLPGRKSGYIVGDIVPQTQQRTIRGRRLLRLCPLLRSRQGHRGGTP